MTTDFIILASASPRRRELLGQIGVGFRVRPAAVPEVPAEGEAPEAYVERIAVNKAEAVWLERADSEPAPVLAADTAVVTDEAIFGKPADESDALAMLARLSGRTHRVLTAVAIRSETGADTVVVVSKVRFRATTAAERLAYCRTDEPYDKAGAYAIQGLGAVFIEHIEGSYSSVMGLPLAETAAMLAPFGMPGWLAAGGQQ